MSSVIGIDLGTTNTVVSVVRDGQASALMDETGQTLIPSVVSFHPNGSVLVGRAAKERRLLDAANTVYSVKRLIGRSWDSVEVRRARSRFPFEMREGPGQAALVVARGETYTLPEISAFVLRKAKSVAEAALGVSVERAVITVPANFNDLQRAATKVAGRVAGLEVVRILNEPTAAALAYGYGRSASERVAVYDFGGGTFDITLLDLSNNVFEVLATAGNTFLGGDDLDLAIAERMSDALLAEQRLDARQDLQLFERLRAAAESIKHRLSSETEARVTLNDVGHGTFGKALHFEYSMTRAEFEHLATPIVERTFDVCQEALGIARLPSSGFDQVLLVGGSSRIPLVRKRVDEFFQKPLRANINPDEVVAIGAAIQAAALSGAEKRRATPPPPPAPSPPVRQSQASVSDSANPPTARGRPGATGPRPRLSSLSSIPTPQVPAPRAPMPTQPGLPPLATPGRASGSGGESTLGVLGRRTRDASDDASSLPLVRPDDPATESPLPAADLSARFFVEIPAEAKPKPYAEGVAFAPGGGDFVELEAAHTASEKASPQRSPEDDEAALPLPEVPADEVTHVGDVAQRLARVASVVGRATVPLAPAPAPASAEGSSPAMPFRPASTRLPSAHVLVDVTPLTLAVETVNGFCDPIIERNTQVPCERTRVFVTAADNQTLVRVRISQGESSRFPENTLLGEVELSGLRPTLRGQVQIALSFSLDTNGMLNVSAKELATGRATSAQIRLIALPDAKDVAWMTERNSARQV